MVEIDTTPVEISPARLEFAEGVLVKIKHKVELTASERILVCNTALMLVRKELGR